LYLPTLLAGSAAAEHSGDPSGLFECKSSEEERVVYKKVDRGWAFCEDAVISKHEPKIAFDTAFFTMV
jgi:hypothetical protein